MYQFILDNTPASHTNAGFCMMSCGNCKCCDTPWNVISKIPDTSRFLQAVEATNSTLERILKSYGYTSTILVPNNDAWEAALTKYGDVLQNPAVLAELIKFHILPPEPRTRGLWTTPFFAVGATLYSLYDGTATLKTTKMALPNDVTAYGGLTGITISSPVNSAKIVAADIRSCKTYVDVIDEVLLPVDLADVSNSADPVATFIGTGSCSVEPNQVINGTVLEAGSSNIKSSVGECCDACGANAQCNVWTYCSKPDGCRWPDGTVWTYGACELLRSPEIADNQTPAYGDSGIDVVPIITGYKPSSPAPAPATVSAAGRR